MKKSIFIVLLVILITVSGCSGNSIKEFERPIGWLDNTILDTGYIISYPSFWDFESKQDEIIMSFFVTNEYVTVSPMGQFPKSMSTADERINFLRENALRVSEQYLDYEEISSGEKTESLNTIYYVESKIYAPGEVVTFISALVLTPDEDVFTGYTHAESLILPDENVENFFQILGSIRK